METDVDYYGNDVGSVQTLYPWTCCDLCQATDGCEFYTFWNLDPNGPTCYMKSSAAGRTTKSGALSGMRCISTIVMREGLDQLTLKRKHECFRVHIILVLSRHMYECY
jgi:hypothetical protein